jgi:DNA repair protein SbcD/Mre11
LQTAVAQQDIAGAFIRVRWTIAEEDRHEVDRAAIMNVLAGATEVKLEGRIVPVVRTRAAGIAQAHGLVEKVKAWAEVTACQPDPLLACLEALSTCSVESIAASVLCRRDVGPPSASGSSSAGLAGVSNEPMLSS